MEKLDFNGKTLEYGSILLSPSERFALGMQTGIENEAVIIKAEIKSDNVTLSTRTRQLVGSYFSPHSVNFLFFDIYKIEAEVTKKLLEEIYKNSIASDAVIIGLRKNESPEELRTRLEFSKSLKANEKKPIIFLVDPRTDIPVEELKKYKEHIDMIGLYCNVPFGGQPLLKRIVSANLALWQESGKPVFLVGIPRKMRDESSKDVKYYHPFFSLLSNLFCTHFKHGASKSKYVEPDTNIVYTYDKLVKKFGEDFELENICDCEECKAQTVKSFFSGKEGQILKRIRVHETFITQNQIENIKAMTTEQRVTFLSRKINKRLGPEIAQMGEINNIGVRSPLLEKFVKEMMQKIQGANEVT